EAQHEAKLSNLHIPLFASLVLKSNWEIPSFKLEYEVLIDSESIKIDDLVLTVWTKSFFSSLNKAIEAFQENHLSITIEPQSEGVRFFFDFSGIIKHKEQLEEFLTDQNQSLDLLVKEFTESELALEVFMPVL
ncbi:Spo0B C-terminal domain-containing protein, partial [Neobacillus sp.]|uniref:Spo0B C-terminal domain-containing protein n=1 Tax=Neobacillus sp. TaxID=2675273 RepID=UPI0028A2C16D